MSEEYKIKVNNLLEKIGYESHERDCICVDALWNITTLIRKFKVSEEIPIGDIKEAE